MECLRQILKFHASRCDGVNHLILNQLIFQIFICSTQQLYHRKTWCSSLQHRPQKAEFWITNRSNSNFKLDFQFFLCKLNQQSTGTLIHFNTIDGKPTINLSCLTMDLNSDPTKQAKCQTIAFYSRILTKLHKLQTIRFPRIGHTKRCAASPDRHGSTSEQQFLGLDDCSIGRLKEK